MKNLFIGFALTATALFAWNALPAQNFSFYLTGGYTFTRAPLKTYHEFIGLYNENPVKRNGYVFTHGFDNMKCLKGLYYGVGMNYRNSLLFEINYSRKFNHTFAYYDPANNPTYLRVDIGYGIGTVEAAVLFPRYYGSGRVQIAPGIGMGFLSRKLYYWDDDTLQISPRRKDMIVETKKGSFSLDPMLQVSYKPFAGIPIEIVARTYYQAMFSRMSVGWLGNFDGYWSPADTASKKLTGGNLGITFAVKLNIADIKIKKREKPPKPPKVKEDGPVVVDFVLNGMVTDERTAMPLHAVIVLYVDDKPVATTFSQSGEFTLKPELNTDYTIEVKAFGYVTKTEKIRFSSASQNPYKYSVSLQKIAMGQAIVLENILFEKASAVLLPESFVELDKLLQFMRDNAGIRIEIAGHTSSDGDDAYNMKLSQDRADSVAKYLIDKGIARNRIVSKGYGENNPVAGNDTEDGRRLNRRVEFKIIE